MHINLTVAGRQLKARAAKVPGCLLSATQCTLPELVSLTRQVQILRQRLSADGPGSGASPASTSRPA